jgi:SAM-dependent methyltransferase
VQYRRDVGAMGGPSRTNGREHWDTVHGGRPAESVSWYQATPTMSLRLLETLGATVDDAITDVGGGAGWLASALAERGYRDVTVVEWSSAALKLARQRGVGEPIELVHADVLEWRPPRRYDVWHDRAVFHFLTSSEQRDRYRASLLGALSPGGAAVVGAFASDGPPSCSGLPVERYDAAGLIDELGPTFAPVACDREVHVTPRGVTQPMTWVAVRRVS